MSQLRVDFALTLLLDDDSVIRIEAPFDLKSPDDSFRLPLGKPHEVSPALPLLHQAIALARIERVGSLRLEFEDGWTIDVPPDSEYESWQVTVATAGMWVGLPGGGVAVFPPT